MSANYHLELRQFPKRLHQYNLDGPQIGRIALLWVQEKMIELAEQKWSPHAATITIIEGPHIPLENVSMARGWTAAQRDGSDVTEQVLGEARQALTDGVLQEPPAGRAAPAAEVQTAPAPVPAPARATLQPAPPALAATSAGPNSPTAELGSLLGSDATRLLAAWRSLAERARGLTPSETLALAERELQREGPTEP